MFQSKPKVKENDKNGVAVPKRRSTTTETDHWAFLEEIEAPMWADLTLEPNLTTGDEDDEWFHTSHPFHHHSARRLRSAFAHPDLGNDFFHFNLQLQGGGVSSPKLPSSVSKSRGKDYRNRVWGSNARLSIDKGHPVNDLGSKPKAISCRNQNGGSSSITSLSCNNSSITSLNSQSVSTSEGVSVSTVTTETGLKQHSKVLETSKEAFGNIGGLLNSFKAYNLRRSYATRPASRVEICNDRGSKERKSSCGKSSVGPSNSGGDIKSKASEVQKTDLIRQVKAKMDVNREPKGCKSSAQTSNMGFSNMRFQGKKATNGLGRNEDRTLNIRNLGKLGQPAKGRMKASSMAEASTYTRNAHQSRLEGRDTSAASTTQESTKSKVVLQKIEKNTSNQPRVEVPGAKSKVGSNRLNGLAYSGKENMRGRAVLSQRPGGKGIMPVVRVVDQKLPNLKLENKVGKTAEVGSKVRSGREKISKLSSNARVYLR